MNNDAVNTAPRPVKENKENSLAPNRPRYMQMTAGEKSRRQSMLVKPSVPISTLRKRPAQEGGSTKPSGIPAVSHMSGVGNASTRSSIASVRSEDGASTSVPGHVTASPLPTFSAQTPPPPPSTSNHGSGLRHKPEASDDTKTTHRLTAELKRVNLELAATQEENTTLKAKVQALEEEVKALKSAKGRQGNAAQEVQNLLASRGDDDSAPLEAVSVYCQETDERMRKLTDLIDRLQSHLNPNTVHAQPTPAQSN